MSEIVFTTRLTVDDWDEAMHGWRCHVLNVPGAIVEAVYVDGNRVDTARYEVLAQNTFIRWIAPDQPQRVAASIKLTETLSLGKETERWKRLAIILPVVATVAAAAISGAATYFSRASDLHVASASNVSKQTERPDSRTSEIHASAPPTISPQQELKVLPEASDGPIIDIIDIENTNFNSMFAIDVGRTYMSRFRDNDASLYYSFHQHQGAHDLNIVFTLVSQDVGIGPMMSIYDQNRIKLFSRWHEKNDGSSIKWTAPITPGDYILEITPRGASSSFARFLVSLAPG